MLHLVLLLEGGICNCTRSIPPPEDVTPDDEDVYEEENTVKHAASEGVVNANIAVQICGLVKTYPSKTKIGCCKCEKTSHYHALKVTVSFHLLCLLYFGICLCLHGYTIMCAQI